MPEWVNHLHQTLTRADAIAIATTILTGSEDMPSLTECSLMEAARRALLIGIPLETTVNNTTSLALCQGQTDNSEESMKNYVAFTIKELHTLSSRVENIPIVMHNNKAKELRRITFTSEGSYKVTLRLNVNRNYLVNSNEKYFVDVGPNSQFKFHPEDFWTALGTRSKFRCSDWLPGHWGVFVSKDEVYDSVRGRRSVGSLPSRIRYFDESYDKLRQDKINELKHKFIEDPAANMTCGFELETQSTCGLNRRSMVSEGRRLMTEQLMFSQGPGFIPRWMRNDLSGSTEVSSTWVEASDCNDRLWRKWLTDNNYITYDDLVKAGLINQLGIERLNGWLSQEIDEDHIDTEQLTELMAEKWGLSANVDIVCDESVSGFELRTNGPKTVTEFEEAAVEAFKLDHNIDTRCSFHIHIKVNGINHTYNRAQRQHIIRYLFKNAHRLPEGVRQRWADENANYFFLPDDGDDKMNFINFHSRYMTLEFRCFGNVTTVEEGNLCLELAVEALQDYYANETSLFIDSSEWGHKARATMGTGDPSQLDKFAEAHLEHLEVARENQVLMEKILPELNKIKSTQSFNFTVGA